MRMGTFQKALVTALAAAWVSGLVAVLGLIGTRDEIIADQRRELSRAQQERAALEVAIQEKDVEIERLKSLLRTAEETLSDRYYGAQRTQDACITFDDKPPGARYTVDDFAIFSGVGVDFLPFSEIDGGRYVPTEYDGSAVLVDGEWMESNRGYYRGIRTNRINLLIELRTYAQRLEIRYEDWGDAVNLMINRAFHNLRSLSDTDSIVFNGLVSRVRETSYAGRKIGILEVYGESYADIIVEIMIGGEDLIIDHICTYK